MHFTKTEKGTEKSKPKVTTFKSQNPLSGRTMIGTQVSQLLVLDFSLLTGKLSWTQYT